ncbi:MAG TPA: bifunctional UDP-sugar hydrolase/5'-nucleotidase, partial [Candidatus Ozemobacteraceae bacterium]|nr:bifunctional UDP-sugar hydrolase/5'-nucleotidase [Candidatus Ozemobacteraceae bacterium]
MHTRYGMGNPMGKLSAFIQAPQPLDAHGRLVFRIGRARAGDWVRLAIALAFVVLAATGVFAEPLRQFTILHTNDLHSHLLPFDQVDFGKNVGGAARLAELVKRITASTSNWVLLDGGDLFQGTPFYSSFFGEVEAQVAALIGYTATVLGNHDLDDGLSNLRRQYASCSVPLLCANVLDKSTGKPAFTPWLVADRSEVKVGIIGAIGSAAWDVISHKRQRELTFLEHEPVVASIARHLRPQVDLVILLSHAGYEADLAFAARATDIDVIVGGHTNSITSHPVLIPHLSVPGKPASTNSLGGTLVVQAFKWGVFLGRLDLTLRADSSIATYSGQLLKVDDAIATPEGSPVARLVDSYHERIKALTSQVIGHSASDLLYPDEEKHLQVFPLGVWVCDAMREFVGADFGIINSGTIRDRLASGPVTMGSLLS